MSIYLIILAEFVFVALLILLFYKLKPWLGLVPLFVLIGSNQYFQTVLATSFRIVLFDQYTLSPGSVILFSASMFTILLIYIKEGTAITQKLILAIVLTNIAFTALSYISFQQSSQAQQTIMTPGTAPDFFKVNTRVFFVGSIALILDAFIIVILYEFFYTRIKWLNLFFRLLVTMLVVLNIDALIFILGGFWGSEKIGVMLISQFIGKSFSAVFFATVLFLYLRYFDKDKNQSNLLGFKGNEDIFNILSYQGKLEKLKIEMAINEEYLQKIIDEKTAEQNKALRRHAIMASVQDLRIDKFSTAEQAKEFLVKVKNAFEVDACSIHLIKGEDLQMLASIGIAETGKELKMALSFPYIKEMINTKKNLFIEDTRTDSKFNQELSTGNNLFKYLSCAGAPLVSGNNVIGLLKLYSIDAIHSFTHVELEHLQLVANQIAHAIEANLLFSQNEKQKEVLVKEIIARKKVEEAIKESEEKYRTLIEQANDALFLADKQLNFILVNSKACNLLGYTPEELINLSIPAITYIDPDEPPLMISERSALLVNIHERKMIHKNGTLIPVEINGKSLEDGNYMAFVRDITERKKALEQIEKYNTQLRQLTGHLQSIREEERRRIGREIHDDLGQQLTAIKMDAAWIDKNTPAEFTLKKEKLKNILDLLDGSNTAVRRILSELKPSILDEYGLLDTLDWLASQFTANTGVPVKISCSQKEIKLPENIATCIFRVFQESLTNITRYASAKNVISLIALSDTQISVTITDDGVGFDVSKISEKGTFGLLGMQERVNAVNGSLVVESNINSGTSISMKIPFKA